MSTTTLWVSQIATFMAGAVVGGLVVYWGMTARARRLRGGAVTDQTKDRSKAAVFIIGLCAILIVFGLQVRDANQRAAEQRHQALRFQAQQKCLNDFTQAVGKYLVDTLNKRASANDRLTAAQKHLNRAQIAKDAANDRVVEVVAGGTVDNPPSADAEDFRRALERFRVAKAALVKATAHFNRVAEATKNTLDATGTTSKAYDPPKVDCAP